jgi:hypothetical protein
LSRIELVFVCLGRFLAQVDLVCLDEYLFTQKEVAVLRKRGRGGFVVKEHHMPIWRHAGVGYIGNDKRFFYRPEPLKILEKILLGNLAIELRNNDPSSVEVQLAIQ